MFYIWQIREVHIAANIPIIHKSIKQFWNSPMVISPVSDDFFLFLIFFFFIFFQNCFGALLLMSANLNFCSF